MKLYQLISDLEKKACKALDIRNVLIKDLTVEELGHLGDILKPDDDETISAIKGLEEILLRQAYADN